MTFEDMVRYFLASGYTADDIAAEVYAIERDLWFDRLEFELWLEERDKQEKEENV